MNEAILARFESYRRQLVESPAIAHYSVVKLRAGSSDGHIRVRASLIDDGLSSPSMLQQTTKIPRRASTRSNGWMLSCSLYNAGTTHGISRTFLTHPIIFTRSMEPSSEMAKSQI